MMFGFPVKLLPLILCPKDSGTLAVPESAQSDFIETGVAQCGRCGAIYEIQKGILLILPGQRSLDPVTREEQSERDLQAERYDAHFSEWANSVELSALLKESSAVFGKTILDLACGTGRITTSLLPRARGILASDLSQESLAVFSKKLGPGVNIGLVWADATQLRIAPESVDLAISTQLLEHIPSADQRAQFLEGVHSALRADGVFLLTVYYYSVLRRLLGRRQEGYHAGGIFYRRFTREDVRRDFSGLFRIGKLQPIQIDLRLFRGSIPILNWVARGMEKTFFRNLIGQLLFVKASKTQTTLAAN